MEQVTSIFCALSSFPNGFFDCADMHMAAKVDRVLKVASVFEVISLFSCKVSS